MNKEVLICPVCHNEDFDIVDLAQGYTEKYRTTGVIMDAERFITTGYKTKKTCTNCKLELIFNKSDKEIKKKTTEDYLSNILNNTKY